MGKLLAEIGIRQPRSLLSLQRVISSLGLQFTRDGGRSRTSLERPLAPLGSSHQLDIHEAKNYLPTSVILGGLFWKKGWKVEPRLSIAKKEISPWIFFFSTRVALYWISLWPALKVSALGEIKSSGKRWNVFYYPRFENYALMYDLMETCFNISVDQMTSREP